MMSDGFSVWSFSVSRLASSSITKKVPEPIYESNDSIIDYIGYALILLGLIVGLVGYFRKNRGVDWSKKLK
jgi:hypothetical protein